MLRDVLIQKGQLGEGYNEEMQTLHNKNAELLNDIIDTIGYPTIDKVGEKGSEAAWLIIQHSIGRPGFMKKCLRLLEKEVKVKNANQKHLAYLSDRISVFEGKVQLYGTQFDWNENGELSPYKFDNISSVNERRKSLGLNTLEDQTKIIRKQAELEKERPPKDFQKRLKEIEDWRASVGWKN